MHIDDDDAVALRLRLITFMRLSHVSSFCLFAQQILHPFNLVLCSLLLVRPVRVSVRDKKKAVSPAKVLSKVVLDEGASQDTKKGNSPRANPHGRLNPDNAPLVNRGMGFADYRHDIDPAALCTHTSTSASPNLPPFFKPLVEHLKRKRRRRKKTYRLSFRQSASCT
jgi:hypothetical protein